jgi:hypothetical protein
LIEIIRRQRMKLDLHFPRRVRRWNSVWLMGFTDSESSCWSRCLATSTSYSFS